MGDDIDGAITNRFSDPVAYNSDTRTHTIEATNMDLLGFQPYTVMAYLVDYPSMQSAGPDATALIEFIDPCSNPVSVTATPQSGTKTYDYSRASAPPFTFKLRPFAVEPSACFFKYSCDVISGPRLDLCSAPVNDRTKINFDPMTGNYYFETSEMWAYPPGDYVFEITGSVGTKSDSITFVMTLLDPCPGTQLKIVEPDPFRNATYLLGEPQLDQFWDIESLFTYDTFVDCGTIEVDFFYDDEYETPVNSTIFLDDRPLGGLTNSFAVRMSEDVSISGTYPIKYRARLKDYPSAIPAERYYPFVIRIGEPSKLLINEVPEWLLALED